MKSRLCQISLVAGSLLLIGCHRHEHGHHDHEHSAKSSHGHSHGDDAQSFSGATHKEGTGITLRPETKERLGVKVADVEEKSLPRKVSFTAKIFSDGTKSQFLASAIIPAADARLIPIGTPVKLQNTDGLSFNGVVTQSANPISTNETEILVRFAAEKSSIRPGSFLQASVRANSDEPVIVIPNEALIRGASEAFVYVQNGNSYLRTVVEPGRSSGDAVEIKDGLLEGDSVVTHGVMDLWLVELRAVKGGQGCCPAPPTKGKGK